MSGSSGALAVIVHFGAIEPTVRLANSMAGFDRATVVVVANDEAARPEELATGVEWVVSTNTGYFGALRVGLESLTTQRCVVLLNNDIEISEMTFDHCLDVLDEDPRLGVVGPVLTYGDGRMQSGAGFLEGLTRAAHTGVDPGPRLTSCTWVTGAAMFINGEALQKVGFDVGYFLGGEDLDLCVRMARRGYGVACDGRVAAVHAHSAEIGTLWNYYGPRNTLWFARKHYAIPRRVMIGLRLLLVCARVVAADFVRRRGIVATALYLTGVRDGALLTIASEMAPDSREPIAVEIAHRWTGRSQRWRRKPSV